MRLGAKSCTHYFGNQSLEWRYEGVVQEIKTNAFGVKVAQVLYEEDDEATESALHHLYPLDEDDEPYDGDVKKAEDVYRAEIAASKAKKGKKKAKPPASSGTAKKGTGEPAKKKAKTKSASKTWALPDLEWTKVNEFDDERNPHRPKSFLNTTRTADYSAWDEGQYLLHCLPGNWKEIAKKMNEDKRMTGRAKVTQEEVQLFVALVFAMSVQPLANRSDYTGRRYRLPVTCFRRATSTDWACPRTGSLASGPALCCRRTQTPHRTTKRKRMSGIASVSTLTTGTPTPRT